MLFWQQKSLWIDNQIYFLQDMQGWSRTDQSFFIHISTNRTILDIGCYKKCFRGPPVLYNGQYIAKAILIPSHHYPGNIDKCLLFRSELIIDTIELMSNMHGTVFTPCDYCKPIRCPVVSNVKQLNLETGKESSLVN